VHRDRTGRKRFVAALAAAALLGTVGPVQAGAAKPALRPAAPQRTAVLTPAQLGESLARFEEGRWIREHGGPLRCGVRVFRYEYLTKGGAGEAATASAALMVPTGSNPACRAPHATVVTLHGTMWDQTYDLAALTDPANAAANRSLSWAAIFAAQGYVVIAPNYVGFASSSADYHPYLDYEQQSRDVIDAIAAGKRLLSAQRVRQSGKLFLTGFSQGGWVAMAVHRKLEATGQKLTASMPAAGSYLLTPLLDDLFLGRPIQGSTIYFPMALTAAQRARAGVYGDPAQFFSPRYAAGIEDVLPAPGPFAAHVRAGRLPATAIFSSAVPALPADAPQALKALAGIAGPESGPAHLRPTNRLGIGPDALVQDSARLAYLSDMAANPDGAWPVWTNGQPAREPAHPLRRWFYRSDMRGWIPRAPLTMCGGSNDPAVPFHLTAELMMRYWSSPGTRAPAGRVALLNFDDPSLPKDRYFDLRLKAAEYSKAFATRNGGDALVEAYHNIISPRFCYLAARQWFETMR
jgi:dienelactone hydrolase